MKQRTTKKWQEFMIRIVWTLSLTAAAVGLIFGIHQEITVGFEYKWQDKLWHDNMYDNLTEEERKRFVELWDAGVLTERNLPELTHNFLRSPSRERAFYQGFDEGFATNVARGLGKIRIVPLYFLLPVCFFVIVWFVFGTAIGIIWIGWKLSKRLILWIIHPIKHNS